ncbi:voltage-dependent calcium channel gamma-like subunit isoform X1 [Lepisosteus oculatus]|uniref:voltage-dependent calcium channel gamma-like subunit isoform X1 n=1 Tax=Lepisosteus oculatus TaxID=7918 RepID=UPI0035F50EE0
MTAIKIKSHGGAGAYPSKQRGAGQGTPWTGRQSVTWPQTHPPTSSFPRSSISLGCRRKEDAGSVHFYSKPKPPFLEIFTRSLIILCTAFAIVLSSIAVCDGHWLLAEGKMFGLWHFCTLEDKSLPNCTTDLGEAGVDSLPVGLVLCRSVVSFSVVAAIFGLELLVMSQVCEDQDSRKRWSVGSALVLLSFTLSASGLLGFVALLWSYASLLGFSLTFWCQFTAAFLFFLNGMSGHHIHSMVLLPVGNAGKILG